MHIFTQVVEYKISYVLVFLFLCSYVYPVSKFMEIVTCICKIFKIFYHTDN